MLVGTRHRIAMALFSLFVGSVGFSPALQAAPPASGGDGKYCVVLLKPAQAGSKAVTPGSLECFETFEDSIFHATGYRVLLPSEASRARQLALLRTALTTLDNSVLATYLIAIDFTDANYSGYSLTWYSSVSCPQLQWASSMPAGWNDVVSSTQGFSPCTNNILYEHVNFGGAQQNCLPSCASLGLMDNQASSRAWF